MNLQMTTECKLLNELQLNIKKIQANTIIPKASVESPNLKIFPDLSHESCDRKVKFSKKYNRLLFSLIYRSKQ